MTIAEVERDIVQAAELLVLGNTRPARFKAHEALEMLVRLRHEMLTRMAGKVGMAPAEELKP